MNVDGALTKLRDTIMEEFPDLAEVFEEAKLKDLTDHTAMEMLLHVVSDHPEMAERLNELALDLLEPLRDEGPLVKHEPPEKPGVLFDSGVGLPRLNPLYEAALVERAQYDGDMPEFRTGPLPEETMPSVPVKTDARSPVAIGKTMENAAYNVLGEVREARKRLLLQVEEIAEAEATGTDLVPADQKTDLAKMARGSAETDPESYRRGQLPSLQTAEGPTGEDLALMSDAEATDHAWNFLSTSHGRRSALNTILVSVASRLSTKGIVLKDPTPGTTPTQEDILAYAEWTMNLSGKLSVQARFSLIDAAVGALTVRLLDQLDWPVPETALEVFAINTVDVGKVGWAARLVE